MKWDLNWKQNAELISNRLLKKLYNKNYIKIQKTPSATVILTYSLNTIQVSIFQR